MQTLEFNVPNNLDLLHDELIEGIAGFTRVLPGDPPKIAAPDCGRVEGLGDFLRVTFADDISPDLVTAIVLAHVTLE